MVVQNGNFEPGTYYYYIQLILNSQSANGDGHPTVYVDGNSISFDQAEYDTDSYDRFYYKGSVTITAPTRTVTYTVLNGKWDDDETTENKTEYVADGGTLTSIPNVGNKPNGGYREGSWSPIPNTSTTITENKTYTYTYAPITVTFDANGGTVTPESMTVGTDGKLTAFPEVQRNGFTFDGWFDGENQVDESKVYTADTTLVAHWTETPPATNHTVTYHVVNGKWDDDSTDDKSETTEDNGFLHNIPAVGNKPNANYRAGSWSPSVPDTETRITGNRTYTYTYAQNSPTYNVTVTSDGHGEAYANKRSGVSGTKVMLKEVPDDDYIFKQWEVVSGGVELDNYRDSTTSFTIKSADVEIKAHFDKLEEHTREKGLWEESDSKSEAAWTPEKAAATIAAEKAEKQQAAGTQMVAVQTMLRTKTSDRAGTGRNVIDLEMTKIDIHDRSTVNLLVLNNKFEYNIKIPVVGGLTTTVKIPANFNFRPFIKADGTMNIHEVLWSIVQKKATRKGSIYMIRRE